MKIVDSFLFSEPYEKELLLLKFILEDNGICEWIIIENAYSFQGSYKGLHARNLIESDVRFEPYRNKIKIISVDKPTDVLEKDKLLDDKSFKHEYWQRDLALDYFLENYNNEDWIIISDVDESLDCTDKNRFSELLSRATDIKNNILHVSTKRYWFDFDNEYKIIYGIPMCRKQYLLSNNKKLHEVRVMFHADLKMRWRNIIGFEYTSCFKIDEIIRKINTYAHTSLQVSELEQSLRCNHRTISKYYPVQIQNNKRFFLETVKLTRENSPQYVRDNLAFLKTNNIDKNYKENRRADYPELFTMSYYIRRFVRDNKAILQKKFRYALRKLKMEKLIYGSSIH